MVVRYFRGALLERIEATHIMYDEINNKLMIITPLSILKIEPSRLLSIRTKETQAEIDDIQKERDIR